MKTRILLLNSVVMVMLALGVTKSFAADSLVTTNITVNTTFSSSKTYLLQGYIYVKKGVTLTIEPGTVIHGASAPKLGALIVTAGAKIIADGTADHPIVFTSAKAAGARARGDWGGLILLGYAPHNLGGAQIEGIIPNEDTKFGPLAATRDGVAVNAHDNSGILRYVRVEFAGYALSPNNEINGITFGAVGDGTTIDYVQVSYANDDSFEWFGGTVNCKHLIALRGIDDDFDTDNGYTGKNQFLVSLRDPNVADQSNSKGFESDNNADGTADLPQTRAIFANTDVIAGGDTTNSLLYQAGGHIRRNSGMYSINNIVLGWPEGFRIDGGATNTVTLRDTLVINNIVTVKSGVNSKYINSTTGNAGVNSLLLNNANNSFGTGNSFVGLTNPYNLTAPNFLPTAGSLALTKGALFTSRAFLADSTNPSLGIDPFWDTTGVNYIGAFGTFDWTAGWANFNPVAGDLPTVNPTAVCTKKGVTPTLSKAIFVNDVCKTGRISVTGLGGQAAAGEVYKYTWGKLNFAADGKTVVDTTILYTDTTAGSLTELAAGSYVAKVKLGNCSSKFVKVAKLTKYVPSFSSFTAGTDTIKVKVTLGKIFTAMSGYAFLIRYADSANAAAGKWSIWSGTTNQNTYYDNKGKDPVYGPIWRDVDTTNASKPNLGTGSSKDYMGNSITKIGWMTPGNGFPDPNAANATTTVRFNNSLLRADASKTPYGGSTIKVPITPSTKYQFQLLSRCFNAAGTVVYGDIISSPRYDSISTKTGKLVKMYITKALPKVKFAAVSVADASAASVANKETLVYPNPSKGIVNLSLAGYSNKVSIKVISVTGVIVYSATEASSVKLMNKTIDLSKVPSGNYFIVITDGAKKETKQVVIIR